MKQLFLSNVKRATLAFVLCIFCDNCSFYLSVLRQAKRKSHKDLVLIVRFHVFSLQVKLLKKLPLRLVILKARTITRLPKGTEEIRLAGKMLMFQNGTVM